MRYVIVMSDLPNNSKSVLNLLVAHMPEAKPLLRQFALSEVARSPLPVFANDAGVCLTVTGNGATAMSAAVKALASWQGDCVAPAWLNIGIAGHGSAGIGSGLLVNKIVDARSENTYFPTPGTSGLPVTALWTVTEVERSYPQAVAYDMEGAAFWEAASCYGQMDQIQLFKIVSDNPEQHVDDFRIEAVAGLFRGQETSLATLVETMRNEASEYQRIYTLPKEHAALIARYHFTATQRVQLEKLLRRWIAFERPSSFSSILDEYLKREGGPGFDKPGNMIIERLETELRNAESAGRVG